MKIATVVIGTDFSDSADLAARWAATDLLPEATIILVHALELPELPGFLRGQAAGAAGDVVENVRAAALDRLTQLGRAIGPERVRPEVRAGGAVDAILEAVDETDAELIVVGAHGRGSGLIQALGSTAERLLQAAPVPVLVGRGVQAGPPASLLLAVEDANVTPGLLRWTAAFARRFRAGVTLLHVITPHLSARVRIVSGSGASREFDAKLEESARAWLNRVAREAELDPDRTSREVMFGEARREIPAVARRLGADLIVMGSRGAGMAGQILLGSVARAVLRTAHCPVLVITGRVA